MTLPMGEVPNRPDYPPKSPPPPKRPLSPPRPETLLQEGTVVVRPRPRVRIVNRQAANWTLDAAPWARSSAGPKAARLVAEKLEAWGYRLPGDGALVRDVTRRLADAALEDDGARISVHLADQDQHALILILSHQPGQAAADQGLLTELAALGVVSCGTDTDREDGGRRRWALIQL